MEEMLSKLPPFSFSGHYATKMGDQTSMQSSLSSKRISAQTRGVPESFRPRAPVVLQDANCSPRCWLALQSQDVHQLQEKVTFFFQHATKMEDSNEQRPVGSVSCMRAGKDSMQAGSMQQSMSGGVASSSSSGGDPKPSGFRPQPPSAPLSTANPRPGRTIPAQETPTVLAADVRTTSNEEPQGAMTGDMTTNASISSPLKPGCSHSELLAPLTPERVPDQLPNTRIKPPVSSSSKAESQPGTINLEALRVQNTQANRNAASRSTGINSPPGSQSNSATGTSISSSSRQSLQVSSLSEAVMSKPSAASSSTIESLPKARDCVAGSPSKQPQMPSTPAPSKARPGRIKSFFKGIFSQNYGNY